MISGMREKILAEIKRLAAENGVPPGKKIFAKQIGIREHQWSGVLWARWSDALAEAGFEKNVLQARFATEDVLAKILEACRHYGRVPTSAEMRLYRTKHSSFPSHNTISSHFPSRNQLLKALATHASQVEEDQDIGLMIPDIPEPSESPSGLPVPKLQGSVYLLKSGSYYKIGRSDELERRVKEIRISLPEAVSLVHTITTDDPAGIEAYWHRRFADRRANGEWFRLELSDLAAFKRRRYQ